MSQKALYQWQAEVASHFSHLSKAQVVVLALWSFGMVLARSCALSAVALVLAAFTARKENTVRQQLREFCYEAKAKRGAKRQQLDVESCFVPLLAWVLSWWQGNQLALALDATSLGDRFVVLAVSVLYRGCAIPVAWQILPAQEKHAWRGEWLRLLRVLRPAIPRAMFVIVLTDRGLYARWLFRRIRRLGWHPCLRINKGGTFRPTGQYRFRPLTEFVPQVGSRWQGTGTAFSSPQARLNCTLLACWEAGYKDPWLLLTDLPPTVAEAAWYGLRSWIEQGFKITKRAGWQWHKTRMTDPARAARLWLAVAVATLWLLSVGAEGEATIPESTLLALPAGTERTRRATRLRLVSCFRRGWVRLWTALLHQRRLPTGRFRPEAWPSSRTSAPDAEQVQPRAPAPA